MSFKIKVLLIVNKYFLMPTTVYFRYHFWCPVYWGWNFLVLSYKMLYELLCHSINISWYEIVHFTFHFFSESTMWSEAYFSNHFVLLVKYKSYKINKLNKLLVSVKSNVLSPTKKPPISILPGLNYMISLLLLLLLLLLRWLSNVI